MSTPNPVPDDSLRPRVAAVIPTYDRDDTIARAINSALEQTYAPAEVIVVDDGSSDDTRAVVGRFGDRVRYLYQANAGVSAARNRGVRAAEADWVAFLDSDDVWLPDHLERIAGAIVGTHGAATLYFSDLRRPVQERMVSQWEKANFSIEGAFELRSDAADWVVRPHVPMMMQSSVFHRDRYLALGGLWESLLVREDTHLLLKSCIGGTACAVAGFGAEMKGDGGARLSDDQGSQTECYWICSVLVWSDLLASCRGLARGDRDILERRLVDAHLRLVALGLRERSFRRVLRHLQRAVLVHPGHVLQRVQRRIWRSSSSGRRREAGAEDGSPAQ